MILLRCLLGPAARETGYFLQNKRHPHGWKVPLVFRRRDQLNKPADWGTDQDFFKRSRKAQELISRNGPDNEGLWYYPQAICHE